MTGNIDLEQVKQYNNALRQYKEKSAQLKAEIEYNNKELESLCTELTAELGVNVTRENIEAVYEDQVQKINAALNSGMAVLSKIASEENKTVSQTVSQTVSLPESNVQPMAQTIPVAPVVASIPQVDSGNELTTMGSAIPANSTAGTVFGGNSNGMELPPLFNLS
jgi:hypothetical protein